MYRDDPILIKPPDDIKIWRYMDVTKYLSILDKQALYFTSANKFTDPFEGLYTKANLAQETQQESLAYIHALKDLKALTGINCWHIGEHESAAMWEIYANLSQGIAVQSTFGRLKGSLEKHVEDDIFVGQVMYIDFERDIIDLGNTLSPFLHKRKSFEFEHELRAIVQKIPGAPKPELNFQYDQFGHGPKGFDNAHLFGIGQSIRSGIYVNIDIDTLIEHIYVSPQAPMWFKELVETINTKFGIKQTTLQSSLAEPSLY